MVEITPQKPKLVLPNWQWPLRLSITVFFLSIAVFVAFKVYLTQIQTEIISINNQIKTEAGKVGVDDENTIVRLSESLAALDGIISNHSYFSNVFSLLSSLTYSKAVFINFNADREKSIINLRGSTQSYTTLAKQIVALRENEHVKSLEISGINFGNSGLDFGLTLGIDPAVFIKE